MDIVNAGAERALITIIMKNPDKILDCEEEGIKLHHFGTKLNKELYKTLIALYQNGVQEFDVITVYNAIQNKELLKDYGDIEYIEALYETRINENNLSFYIEQLKNKHVKRLIYNLGDELKEQALEDDDENIEILLNELQQKVLNVLSNEIQTIEVTKIGETLEEKIKLRASQPKEIAGLGLGWKHFDKITQGYKPNELTVWVAPSKTGKSTMLLNHVRILTIEKKLSCLYIDTEMTSEEQEDRLLAMVSGVPHEEIVNGMFAIDSEYGKAEDKIKAIETAIHKIKESEFYHIYMPNFTIQEVSTLVRKYVQQFDIKYAIFDYIKLPTAEIGGLASAQEYQRLGFITTCLKDLAGMCKIPIITAAQGNQSLIDNTDPDARQIGGSYRILQMASRLIFLRNKTQVELIQEPNKGNQVVRIAYQRNGMSAKAGISNDINFNFDSNMLKMEEVLY